MSSLAVLGGGSGGLATAVQLALAGHDVHLWNRHEHTIAKVLASGEIACHGVLGDHVVRPATVSTDLARVLHAAEAAIVVLPALAHRSLFDDLAKLRWTGPVVLNPGSTGGALHLRERYSALGVAVPPVAELSTLAYVARARDSVVNVTCVAEFLRVATLPGGQAALEWARTCFPQAHSEPDVLATSLSNVNMVLHPPGALLAVAWVEATGGNFRFYVDAMTSGVVRVLDALDTERRLVASRFGHELPSLAEEMARIGTVPRALASKDVGAAIRAGEANQAIRGPDSLRHRYYTEDIPFGLLPLVALGRIAGCELPTARSLLDLAKVATGECLGDPGLDARALGIEGLGVDELLAYLRQQRGTT